MWKKWTEIELNAWYTMLEMGQRQAEGLRNILFTSFSNNCIFCWHWGNPKSLHYTETQLVLLENNASVIFFFSLKILVLLLHYEKPRWIIFEKRGGWRKWPTRERKPIPTAPGLQTYKVGRWLLSKVSNKITVKQYWTVKANSWSYRKLVTEA